MVRRAIGDLPEQEAELVRRHYLEGERFDLVAKDLGLSKSWASRLHTRAIVRLTKRLRGAPLIGVAACSRLGVECCSVRGPSPARDSGDTPPIAGRGVGIASDARRWVLRSP